MTFWFAHLVDLRMQRKAQIRYPHCTGKSPLRTSQTAYLMSRRCIHSGIDLQVIAKGLFYFFQTNRLKNCQTKGRSIAYHLTPSLSFVFHFSSQPY